MFQFYDSPIKSLSEPPQSTTHTHCFNSMIVRLKDLLGQLCQSEKLGFNSMIVRLKERSAHVYAVPLLSFNSMIVRLKVSVGIMAHFT